MGDRVEDKIGEIPEPNFGGGEIHFNAQQANKLAGFCREHEINLRDLVAYSLYIGECIVASLDRRKVKGDPRLNRYLSIKYGPDGIETDRMLDFYEWLEERRSSLPHEPPASKRLPER